MSQYEPFQAVAALGLPVDDVEDLLVEPLALAVAAGPVVAGPAPVLENRM